MQKTALILIALVLCSFSIGFARALPDDGVTSYGNSTSTGDDVIPTPTPEPSNNVTIAPWYGVQSINPNGNPVSFSAFYPAELYITFADAVSYTVNSTFAETTDHGESQSTNQMSAQINARGSYGYKFQVLYDQVVNQSVTITVVSSAGDFPPQTFPIACVNSGFTLDVIVTAVEYPTYPGADEIWNYGYGNLTKTLNDNNAEIHGQMNNLYWLIGGSLTIAIVVSFLVYLIIRHQRHSDSVVNHLKFKGFDEKGKA